MQGEEADVARFGIAIGPRSAAGSARLLCTELAVEYKKGCMWIVGA